MADVARQNLQRHGIADRGRRIHRSLGRRGHRLRRHDRNSIGGQQRFGLGFIEHLAVVCERALDDGACGAEVGWRALARGGRLHQQRLIAAVGREHGERANRLLGRGVVGGACFFKDAPRIGHCRATQPAGHHAAGCLGHERCAGACDVDAAHDGGWRMQEEHHAALRVSEQRAERGGVTLNRSVADDVDRVGARPSRRQHGVELSANAVAQFAQRHPGERRGIGGQHAGAASVGHQRERVVTVVAHVRERFGGGEEVLQRVHAQHAGAADHGIHHGV